MVSSFQPPSANLCKQPQVAAQCEGEADSGRNLAAFITWGCGLMEIAIFCCSPGLVCVQVISLVVLTTVRLFAVALSIVGVREDMRIIGKEVGQNKDTTKLVHQINQASENL